ncbi:MAG: NAD(P)/FAD-dependent oxidoreductase, partial [Ferruginibacter sp.]
VNLAKNLKRIVAQTELHPFSYNDKGTMAIIGRVKATADIPKPKMTITGALAWMMWLFVHLFSLINYRNRIKTMYNWTTSYFSKDQTLRMIIRPKE